MAQGKTGTLEILSTDKNMKAVVHYNETYDVHNNQSVLTISSIGITRANESGMWGYGYYLNGTVKIGTVTVMTMNSYQGTHSVAIPQVIGSEGKIQYSGADATGTATIAHDADGTKTVRISLSFGDRGGYFTFSDSVDLVLTDIPRASKPTISGTAVMGSALTIYTNRKNTGFTHTLRYAFGSTSGAIATSVGDSFSWTVPYDLAKEIRDKTSGTGTIYCDTYNGSTLMGTDSVSFTANVPDNATTKPTMNLSLSPTGSLPAAFNGLYVQGKTGLRAVFNAASTYSTVAAYSFTLEGKAYKAASFTTDTISGSGSIPYSCTVTDARGYTRVVSGTIPVEAYAKPYLSGVLCQRCDSNGDPDSGGTYVHLKFTKNCSPVGGENTCTVKRRHKAEGGSYGSYTDITGNTYDATLSGIATDPEKSYQIQLVVTDAIGETATYTFDIPSQFHTIHLREGGKGIAFGKRSVADLFECNMDAKFDGRLLDSREETGIKLVRCMDYSEIGTTAGGAAFFSEWLKMICREYPGHNMTTFMGLVHPNSYSFVICTIYNTSAVNTDGLPHYSGGIIISAVGGRVHQFGTNNYSFSMT